MKRPRNTSSPAPPVLRYVVPGLFCLVPLVFDSDLYRLALLPKLLLIQAGLLILGIYITTGERLTWRPPGTLLPATLLVLWSIIATFSADISVYNATAFMSHQVTFFLGFVLISQTVTIDTWDRLVRWACASGILFSLIGCLEFWGVDVSAIPSNGRPSSTFAYRNFAATYLAATLPLALWLIAKGQDHRDRIVGSGAACLMALFLVYTRSRGAWLGATAGLVVGGVLFATFRFSLLPKDASHGLKAWAVPLTAALVVVLMAPWSPQIESAHSRQIDEGKTELLDAMSSLSTSGAGRGRLPMWNKTIEMAITHPFFGVGPNNWKLAYPPYDQGAMLRDGSAPERPHNDLLWIASETGILGLLAYVVLLLTGLLAVVRALRDRHPNSAALVALTAGIVAVVVHGCFSFPRERAESSFFLWGALGLIHALAPGRRKRASQLPHPYALPAVLALCTMITILEIRFDRALLSAVQSFQGGDTISLDRHTRDGIEAGAFDSRIYLLRNKVDQANRNYPQAQATLLKGLSYHPHSVELLSDLGMVYAIAGDNDRAETALKRAADLTNHHHQVYNNLGGVYQQKGDFDQAQQAYQRAVEIKRNYPDAWSNLGLVQMMLGDSDAAVRSLAEAVALSSNDPALQHNLADAYYLRNGEGDRMIAARHYGLFVSLWRGDPAETELARQRLEEIRTGQ